MVLLNPSEVCSYIQTKFLEITFKNGIIDMNNVHTAGVFMGSDTRQLKPYDLGGSDSTTTKMLPINIELRWSNDSNESYSKAIEVYNEFLKEQFNFYIGSTKVAFISLLDSCPVDLGRDDDNVCRLIIRLNVYYYV